MNIAKIEDLSVIESIFAPYKKTYFPHIRQDYLKRNIASGNVVLEDGVVGYTNYDVFDDQGQLVNEDLEEILIAYLEEHL